MSRIPQTDTLQHCRTKKQQLRLSPQLLLFSSIEVKSDSASDRTAKTSLLRLFTGLFAVAASEQRTEHGLADILRHGSDVTINIAVDQDLKRMI